MGFNSHTVSQSKTSVPTSCRPECEETADGIVQQSHCCNRTYKGPIDYK
jgi:hypothetical protein